MNFYDYLLRNEKIFGLIIANLKVKTDYSSITHDFSVSIYPEKTMWLTIEGYGLGPDYVFLSYGALIENEESMLCFQKKITSLTHDYVVAIWSYVDWWSFK